MTQPHCKYCGQEDRYGHNAICVMNEVEDLRAENKRLRAAATNLMAAIDDMHSRGEIFTARVSIAACDMQRALEETH